MLRTSFTLTPTAAEGADISPAAAAPPEHVHDVYLCATSPAVTEDWEGPLDAPQVVAGSLRYPIPATAACASSSGGTAAHGDASAARDDAVVALPLEELKRAYEAHDGEERSGSAWVQVYAVGTHAALSAEAKAMLCACVMTVLRAQLSTLLRRCAASTAASAADEGTGQDAATAALLLLLHRCCRGPAHADGGAVATTGGRWRVTWTPELLCHVAASIDGVRDAAALPSVRVDGCTAMLRASVHAALQERMRRDTSSSFGADEGLHSRPLRYGSMHVRLTSCAPVASHPLDLQRVVHLTRELHVRHVQPAQSHAEDGTDAFQRLVRINAPVTDGLEARAAAAPWAAALDSYAASATCAQAAVLLVLQRDMSTHSAAASSGASVASLLPLSTREERSRMHVARQGLTDRAAMPPALRQHIVASVQVRSAAAYFNDVLLFHAWDIADGEAAGLADRLAHDDAVQPACAAMQWRSSLATPTLRESATHYLDGCVGRDRTSNRSNCISSEGQTLSPTPLQWLLYTAQRQLVVAVANRAQVVLTGRRLGLHLLTATTTTLTTTTTTATPLTVPHFNSGALGALAAQCVKAMAITRRLLEWHCPWPAPPHLQQQRHPLDPAAITELLWVLRLLAKLQWRAAQLYAAAGDTAEQRRQLRELRDAVQRWDSRRRARCGVGCSAEGEAWTAPASLEDVVCHVEDEAWAALRQDVSSMLPAV